MKKAHHGGGGIYKLISDDFEHIERNKDAINADGLDAWFDPSPRAVLKLSEYLPFSIKTSPPLHAKGLIKTISQTRGIPKENIIVSGGSSDLMYALFPNLKFKKVVILDPMYGEYKHIFENVLDNIELVKYDLHAEKKFEVDPQEFSAFINLQKPDLVMIVNPNSPAGTFLNQKEIMQILQTISKETLFVIDETYVDFVDTKQSVETLVPKYKNLIVIKSMSKVYALSGARVGYLVADKNIAEQIDNRIPPFQVSFPAQILAVEALKDIEYYREKWDETGKLREDFVKKLDTISDIKIYWGEGNFLLVELINKNIDKAEEIVKKLSEENIFIRNAGSMSDQFGENFLRITVKDAESNQKITSAFKKIL